MHYDILPIFKNISLKMTFSCTSKPSLLLQRFTDPSMETDLRHGTLMNEKRLRKFKKTFEKANHPPAFLRLSDT